MNTVLQLRHHRIIQGYLHWMVMELYCSNTFYSKFVKWQYNVIKYQEHDSNLTKKPYFKRKWLKFLLEKILEFLEKFFQKIREIFSRNSREFLEKLSREILERETLVMIPLPDR